MTTSKDVVSAGTAMEGTISDQNLEVSEPFPLRQLPLELRRHIYAHYLLVTRNLAPEAIYLRKIPDGSRDPPSPLLLVNSQVRAEVLDLVQNWSIFLRVTHQGIQFSSLAETCFIARKCSRDYGSIPRLIVEIWPPHPDRPTDMIDIWRHLRKLRAELRAVPQLQKICFNFDENELASWTHDGKASDLLVPEVDSTNLSERGESDLVDIMDLFARISAPKARFFLPWGLRTDKTTEDVRMRLRIVSAMMQGCIPFDEEDGYSEESKEDAEYQDWLDDYREYKLQMMGAKIAIDKLDVMTRQGRMRLTEEQWEDFITLWSPQFDTLYPRKFKGKSYYVYEDYYGGR